jgi:hypothetical protein
VVEFLVKIAIFAVAFLLCFLFFFNSIFSVGIWARNNILSSFVLLIGLVVVVGAFRNNGIMGGGAERIGLLYSQNTEIERSKKRHLKNLF